MNLSTAAANLSPNHVATSESCSTTLSNDMETTIVTVENASKSPLPSSGIRITEETFYERIQDIGCTKANLKKATYRQNKIPAYGPNTLYYPQLSAIAIDFLKNIKYEKLEGCGWNRLPVNPSDVKVKIIALLLSLRKMGDDGIYTLGQDMILSMISTQWGATISADKTEDNDKLRLFGLLFLERNLDKLHRLSKGVTGRNQLEDPDLLLKGLFSLLAIDFNNDTTIVELPSKSSDLNENELENLDPNEASRIRINRDGK